ncbi:hypothetical protein CJ184_005930 [Actinotignum urinale]|uniref:hypothetical protein n=1 Tax=Actinotignum urinale TaxID=190146 RepID=UPI0015E0C745|nr:hypothetical protein [Actinotignum urinale]MDY5129637.1 hypothetical protein [Actinotignum urinale]WIK58790.1 hypothetical protein CJ184_005930 [Actinotignum urinale]
MRENGIHIDDDSFLSQWVEGVIAPGAFWGVGKDDVTEARVVLGLQDYFVLCGYA